MGKNVTVGLDDDLLTGLRAIQLIKDDSMNAVIKKAFTHYLETLQQDPEWPGRVEAARARSDEIFDYLLSVRSKNMEGETFYCYVCKAEHSGEPCSPTLTDP